MPYIVNQILLNPWWTWAIFYPTSKRYDPSVLMRVVSNYSTLSGQSISKFSHCTLNLDSLFMGILILSIVLHLSRPLTPCELRFLGHSLEAKEAYAHLQVIVGPIIFSYPIFQYGCSTPVTTKVSIGIRFENSAPQPGSYVQLNQVKNRISERDGSPPFCQSSLVIFMA